jgi:hypothetical protein
MLEKELRGVVLLGVFGDCCAYGYGVLDTSAKGSSDWAAPYLEKTWMWIGFLWALTSKVISQFFSYGCC